MRVRSAMLAAVGVAMSASTVFASFSVEISVRCQDTNGGDWTRTWNQQDMTGGAALPSDQFSWGQGSFEGSGYDGAPEGLLHTFPNGAMIHGISMLLIADPSVSSNFNVTAGSTNSTFTITSAVVNHPSFPSAEGRAQAVIGVTNSLASGSGVTLTGLQGAGFAYRSIFNGSTTYADLIAGGTTAGSTTYAGETSLPFVYNPLGGIATSIQSEFKFSLTRLDRASGTSTFEVIPSPSAAALLGLGGLVATRRRRAR